MSKELYEILMFSHLFTVVPCVFLGAYLFIAKKGGKYHRLIGGTYMSLMVLTAIIALFLPALVGPQFLGHFGWIHLFCVLTLYSVPTALLAIRKGNVRRHKIKMISLYVGALMIAGGFTLSPGRYLHTVFFE
jgi:uncharacterized membrane protein